MKTATNMNVATSSKPATNSTKTLAVESAFLRPRNEH